MTTLAEVKAAQPQWFSRQNKRFFNDVGYRILHGKRTRQPFLVRSTYAWTDMFGAPKRLHYRVNGLLPNLTIGPLIDNPNHPLGYFIDMDDVKEWLREQ